MYLISLEILQPLFSHNLSQTALALGIRKNDEPPRLRVVRGRSPRSRLNDGSYSFWLNWAFEEFSCAAPFFNRVCEVGHVSQVVYDFACSFISSLSKN
jgi:hypothetical protein